MGAAEIGVDICCEATLTPRAALGIQTVLARAGGWAQQVPEGSLVDRWYVLCGSRGSS